jgi:glucose-6-phosphate 1-dehydrogenase
VNPQSRTPRPPPEKKERAAAPARPLAGGKPVGPCTMVIFGAGGDLTKRKLVPALYNLVHEGLLPDDFAVVGFARAPLGDDGFRAKLEEDMKKFATTPLEPERWSWLKERTYYCQADFNEAGAFEKLAKVLKQVDTERRTRGNVLFYLAVAPEFFAPVVRNLSEQNLTQEANGSWRRVIVEKPFGHDLGSARQLNHDLRSLLDEQQIYRIDHYLGKETVQNLIVFRFANGIFEPIWNRRYVDHVQITVAETVGVETRGDYYEKSGALRDMVPNHIFQLITLVAMEPPISFEADAVRDEQTKVLRAIAPMSPEDVLQRAVRGQYGEGSVDGQKMNAYRAEPKVRPSSGTETYVAMKLNVENWRWTGVPFYLRVGKALPQRLTEIAITFKRPPFTLFRDTPIEKLAPNQLVIEIQPDEGIALGFGAKIPGATVRLGTVKMDFMYADYFGSTPSTGYERLLYDAMAGDATLFQRADMVEAAWRAVDPILDVWASLPPRSFPNYAAGTCGPTEADELLARDGRAWRGIEC